MMPRTWTSRRARTILGALKLSGKLGGWNVGALSSLTKREFADYQVDGAPGNVEVEPLTSWNAIRMQKDIAGGRQGIGIISTITQRFFNESGLPDQMNRGAYTLGVDGWSFLDKDRRCGCSRDGWAAAWSPAPRCA